MDKNVKLFIEDNIGLINECEWFDLYEQAYEWLSHDATEELTKILSDVLNKDMEEEAKMNFIYHISVEVMNFLHEPSHDILSFPSFERLYLNHRNGIDFDEAQQLVFNYVKTNMTKVIPEFDGEGTLYLRKKK